MFRRSLIFIIAVLFILAIPNIVLGVQSFIPPVVGNIDASTVSDEILTATFDGRLYAWKLERTLAEGNWPVEFDGVICAAPALVDLDSNPEDLEILALVCTFSNNYKLYGLQGNGSVLGGWIKDLNFEAYSSPAIGYIDINGDKRKETILFIGSRNGEVYAWDLKTWKTLSGFPRSVGSNNVVSPSCADIDSDGNDEVIVTTGSGKIVILDYNSEKWKTTGNLDIQAGIASPGVVDDLNGDGTKELIVGVANGTLYVWTWNSKDKKWTPKWSLAVGSFALSGPVIANFDTDKELEIVCYSGEGKIHIINNDGTLLSNTLVSNTETSGVGEKGVSLPEILTSEFFYSYYGSSVTAVKEGNPSVTITEWGLFHHYKQPYILSLFASVDPFSPNGDGRKDTTTINSEIGSPQECSLKLGVYDKQSRLVKKIKEVRYKPSGAEQFTWDGKGDQGYNKGQLVTSETYSILLELESAFSDQVNQLNTVTVDNIPPVVSKVSETLNIITPDEDGIDEKTTISYAVSEPCEVTISFVDSKGKIYRIHKEFIDTRLDPSPNTIHEYTWNGKGDANQLFSGEYTYTIVAEDLAANQGSSQARIITVDVDPPLINGVYAEPEVFSTKSSINSTTIHYSISEDSSVSVAVYTSDNSLAKALLRDEMKSLGSYEIVWDGTNDAGIYESDGYYTYKISAVDERGFKSSTIKAVVEIDSTPPSILQKTVLPSEFSPKASMGTTTTLSFLVSEKAKITIEVLNSVGTVIKTLASDEQVDAGTHSYVWDGTDLDGIAVLDGTYTFKITAEDLAGNIKVSTINVIANSTPPSISNVSNSPNPFTPNGDALREISRIHYTLSGGIGNVRVTVKILDSIGSTVKTLIDNEPYYSGNYTEYWYGDVDIKGGIADSNNDGIVDDGYYTYQIIAVDSHENRAEAVSETTAVSTIPKISISVTPDEFSPNGDGAKDTVTLNYSIDYPMDFIEGEALINIEVLNAKSELLWSKIFGHTAGTYAYEYDGKTNDGSCLPAGDYYVKATAQDALGSTAIPKIAELKVDYTQPEPSDFTVDPAYAKLGTELIIRLSFEEELTEAPLVHLVMSDGAIDTADLVSAEGNNYEYRYTITAEDAEGTTIISAEARDLAFNPTVRTKEFVIDKTDPEIANLSIAPDPASVPGVSGQASIRFNVSESLKQAPRVTVMQSGADSQFAIVSGEWSGQGGECEAKYDVIAGYDGLTAVSIELIDLAGNIGHDESGSFVADSTAPSFSNIAVDKDPAGTGPVTISFTASESFKSGTDPALTINGNPAALTSSMGLDYSFAYNVSEMDKQGMAVIEISGEDPAGNIGTDDSKSFVIDTVPPTLTINGRGANPNPFTPNMLETTSFDFTVSDVTTNAKVDYIKIYNSNKDLVKTLGEGQVTWDGKVDGGISDSNGDGLADEGTYTFEIHAIDDAQNETSESGTLLINRIVLHLSEPAAPTKNVNPTPFSPNVLPETIITFVLDQDSLGPAWPSSLSIMGIKASAVDPIGTVRIEVRTPAGSLVRTLLPNATDDGEREAGTHQITWDGRNSSGQVASSGNYKIIITAEDLVGNLAENESSLTYDVTLDAVSPTGTIIVNNNAQYTTSLSVNLSLSAQDTHSSVVYMQISNDGAFDTELIENYATSKSWTLASGGDGSRTVYVRYQDAAGNWSSFFNDSIYFDETPPGIGNVSDTPDPFSPNASPGVKDDIIISYRLTEWATVTIYVDGLAIRTEVQDAGDRSYIYSPGSAITEGSHSYYIYAIDRAGNSGSSPVYYFTVDNTPPPAPSGLGATSANGVANLSWDTVDGVSGYYIYRSNAYNGTYNKITGLLSIVTTTHQDTGLSNGIRYWYKVASLDSAGNEGLSNYVCAVPGKIDDSKIYFWKDYETWKTSPDGSNQTKNPHHLGHYFDLSSNGNKVTFVRWHSDSIRICEVYIANTDLSDMRMLTNNYADASHISFSPDDTRILFVKGYGEIWIVRISDGIQTKIANGNHPSFSPDGQRIVFIRGGNVWIVNGDGSGEIQLTTDGDGGNSWPWYSDPVFSPDGSKIIFVKFNYGSAEYSYCQIYSMNVNGDGMTALYGSFGHIWNLGFSPDGSKIVFDRCRNVILPDGGMWSDYDVFVMNSNGSNMINVSNDYYKDDQSPVWAPFCASIGGLSIAENVVSQSTTLEAPILVAPEEEGEVRTLRPNFEWKHHKGNTQEYKIDLAKNDIFSIDHQTFGKSANTGSPDKDDPTLYHYTYQIHEFDPGLDRDTYWWKVTAVASNEAATSEVRSFTVAPELTLTGITNYPNPFNPNRERTNIRYRLGSTADEVKIRIYDITGSLVREITNCPTEGERVSIWYKYHDVEWNGRNGRGDMVVNGIYPFEVMARQGDKSVSGRGKIAVLK